MASKLNFFSALCWLEENSCLVRSYFLFTLARSNPEHPPCLKDNNLFTICFSSFQSLKHSPPSLDHFYFRLDMISLLTISLMLSKLKAVLTPCAKTLPGTVKNLKFTWEWENKNCYSSEIIDAQFWFWALKVLLHSFCAFHKLHFWFDKDRAVLTPLFGSDFSNTPQLWGNFKIFFSCSPLPLFEGQEHSSPLKSQPQQREPKN